LSAFERAGVAYLAGSQRSLKIIIESKVYYVHVRDIGRALVDANFKAYILKLSKPFPEQPQEKATEKQAEKES
jgi:hypothetical protein